MQSTHPGLATKSAPKCDPNPHCKGPLKRCGRSRPLPGKGLAALRAVAPVVAADFGSGGAAGVSLSGASGFPPMMMLTMMMRCFFYDLFRNRSFSHKFAFRALHVPSLCMHLVCVSCSVPSVARSPIACVCNTPPSGPPRVVLDCASPRLTP